MAEKKESKVRQTDLMESAHRIWLAGLGAVALAEEEGSKVFKNLVERGEGMEARGKDRVDKAKGTMSGVKTVAESYWDTLGRVIDDRLTAVIHRLGVPTKEEIESLTDKVDNLNKTMDKLKTPAKATAPRKPAAKKATAKAKKPKDPVK
ncbi:MAG: phasin family protein [bacterium]|nr:phasin family protein [bacterium]